MNIVWKYVDVVWYFVAPERERGVPSAEQTHAAAAASVQFQPSLPSKTQDTSSTIVTSPDTLKKLEVSKSFEKMLPILCRRFKLDPQYITYVLFACNGSPEATVDFLTFYEVRSIHPNRVRHLIP